MALSKKTGNLFVDSLVPVVSGLLMLGILMYLAYDWVANLSRELHVGPGTTHEQAVEERIRPIGQVAIAGLHVETPAEPDETAPAVAAAEPEVAQELDGRAVYQAACTACHTPGIAGAPKTGDAAAWTTRLEQGMETLVTHAIEGFQGDAGFMPPRGGHGNLTDEQVRDAVQYMVDALED
jgi:cytochrome c5